MDFLPHEIDVVINGWSICDISYGDDFLIKSKEEAVDLGKRIIMLLELKYDDVKEEDYPNDYPNLPPSYFVEGYESPNCMSNDEFGEYTKSMAAESLEKIIDELFDCDCCD